MPRYLYLLRHAQSAEKQTGQTDKDRVLTPSGVQQSLRIATFFMRQKTFPDIIVSSAASRTKETVGWIADAVKIDSERIFFYDELYEASTRTMFNFVSKIDADYHHVLCVGHNPGISYFGEYLTKKEIGEMVPGSLTIIQLNIDNWKDLVEGSGELIQHIRPDDIKD
jgi:phosphohistidine phosphatase